jgi:hypothetical protein
MDPNVWGPKLWFALHTMTFNYPENPKEIDKRNYYDFFINLKNVIPCAKCSHHYGEHLENNPLSPNLDKKELLVKWLIDLHNEVNKSLNKRLYSYDEVIKLYKDHYRNSNSENVIQNNSWTYKKYISIMFIIIFLISCVTLYIKCFRKKRIFQ